MLYKIISNNDYSGRVYLPYEFNNIFEHKSYSFTRICSGLKECNIQTFTDYALNRNEIKISDDIIENLYIPKDLPYQIQCLEKTLILGPVIGLLLDKNNAVTEKHLKKYMPYTSLYNKIGGLLYVFSLEGINSENKTIEGYFYNPVISNWVKAVLPFPQSIFRRILLSKDTIEKFQIATAGRMFNNNFFDKWKFWKAVNKYHQLAEYLPNTKLLKSISDIDDMFNSFDTLILKPVNGTLGKGLIRVEKINDQYVFKERNLKKPVLTYSREKASKYIRDIKKRHSKYIVQQNIDLLKFEDRLSDFRVIMQKDNTLKWQCTGIVVSMGEPGGICSNYPYSCYLSFEGFFSKYFTLSETKISQKKINIVALCKNVCDVIDVEMGNYGDVGIDIGIDRSLKLWIFEVNEKHYHFMPLLINDYSTYLDVKRNPVKYATALSGFDLL